MTAKTKTWLLGSCFLLLLMPGVMDAEEPKEIVHGRIRRGEEGGWRRGEEEGEPPPPTGPEGMGRPGAGNGGRGGGDTGTAEQGGEDGARPLRRAGGDWEEEEAPVRRDARERNGRIKRGEESGGADWLGDPPRGLGIATTRKEEEADSADGRIGKTHMEKGAERRGRKGAENGEKCCEGEEEHPGPEEVEDKEGREGHTLEAGSGRNLERAGETTVEFAKREDRGRGTTEDERDNDLSPAEGLTTDPTKRLTSGREQRKGTGRMGWSHGGKWTDGGEEDGGEGPSDQGDYTEENGCRPGRCEEATVAQPSETRIDEAGDVESGSTGSEGGSEGKDAEGAAGGAGGGYSAGGNGFVRGPAGGGIPEKSEGREAARAMAGAHEASPGGLGRGRRKRSREDGERGGVQREMTGGEAGAATGDQMRREDNKVNNHLDPPAGGEETGTRRRSTPPWGAAVNCDGENAPRHLPAPPPSEATFAAEIGVGKRDTERMKGDTYTETKDAIEKEKDESTVRSTLKGCSGKRDGKNEDKKRGRTKWSQEQKYASLFPIMNVAKDIGNRQWSPEIKVWGSGKMRDDVEKTNIGGKGDTPRDRTRVHKIQSDATSRPVAGDNAPRGDETKMFAETMKHSKSPAHSGGGPFKGSTPSDEENPPGTERGSKKKDEGAGASNHLKVEKDDSTQKHDDSSRAITRREIRPLSLYDKGSPVVAYVGLRGGAGGPEEEEGLMGGKGGNVGEGGEGPKITSSKIGIPTHSYTPVAGGAKGPREAIPRRVKDAGGERGDESEDAERLPDFLPDSSAGGRESGWGRSGGRWEPSQLRKDGALKREDDGATERGRGTKEGWLRGPGRTLMSILEDESETYAADMEPPRSASEYHYQLSSELTDATRVNNNGIPTGSRSEERVPSSTHSSRSSTEDSIAPPVGPPRASDYHPVQGVKFVARQSSGGKIMYIVEGTGVRVRRWKQDEYGEEEGTLKNKREAGKAYGERITAGLGSLSHRKGNERMFGISTIDKNSYSHDRRNSKREARLWIHSESLARKETKAMPADVAAKNSASSESPTTRVFTAIKSDITRKDDTLSQAVDWVNKLVEPRLRDNTEDRLSPGRNGEHADAIISTGDEGREGSRHNKIPNKPLVSGTEPMRKMDPSHSTPTTLHPFDGGGTREMIASTIKMENPSASPPLRTEKIRREKRIKDEGFEVMQGRFSLRYLQMMPPNNESGGSRILTGENHKYTGEVSSNQTTFNAASHYGSREANSGMPVQLSRKPRTLDSGFGRGRGGGRGSSGDRVLVVPHTMEDDKKGTLTVGMILPHVAFGQREYTRAINSAIAALQRSRSRKLEFFKKHNFTPAQVRSTTMKLTPSPNAILNSLCKEFLSVNVSAILYLMNYEKYGRSTASAQYFLQLAGYLGIPVIAWNADNSGLERRASQSSLQLQLAPSLEHQTAAMLSILERYKWHQFSIVTSQIAGHDDFVQAVRERILDMQDVFKFTILNAVLVTKPSDLSQLVNSESRVVLLYCTRDEALRILAAAADYKITGENYVWVAAQSVIENRKPLPQFPVGMLGVHFDTSMESLVSEIETAVKVYAYGVEDFVNDPRNEKLSLNTQLSCEGAGDSRWKVGDRFFKYLRNVSVEGDHGKPNIEFTADGVLKAAELKIMNLRPGISKQLIWEEVGVWKSWEREGLDIKDIVWPGGSHTPPQGVPEKFHMRITFLEEPPYINVAPPDPITGKCSINRGVLCRFAADSDMSGLDITQAHRNASYYQCCSGFCIDLLEKFSEELGFTYELVRVEDGKWGTLENGKWNGLIADLINRKTDMVMTSLMINSDREAVVDFTVPFMESGIAIVVAKRTGIISPTAFLEPFDTASWMLVGFVAIQASAFTIFFFEWLSPSGFDMKVAPSTNHRFSLFRTYWLVWAVLFQAAVHVDCPKGFTARFMTNVWAMFAVVFLAIYTANLAAFMITREEFHEFSGIDDHRLAKPFSHKPMFKFGTIPSGHTDSTLKKYFREMHSYMKRHNRTVVSEGIEAVLSGELDAFIYDGTVLDYLVSQDEDCRLLTVGSWYAMTGYGLAFQRNSKYVRMFNQRLLDFRENGDLERLRRYWMTGSCKPGKQERKSSDPLALEQFLSAFLLLMSGILLAALLLFLEHLYFKYIRHHLARTDRGGCCALVSLSMGKSLTFRGAVYEAQDMYRTNRVRGRQPQPQHPGGHRAFSGGGRTCGCSYCEGLHNLWATRRELEACRLRIRHLEKQMEAHGIRPLPPPPPQSLPLLLPLPGSSPGSRRYINEEDALRTRDMTRNHVTSTEYCGQLHRPCRTEIAEMETVL